jgi:hypothetical protein
MKVFLILWVTPIVLLGSWYGLSYYDMNFGFRILSRDLHDLVFTIYGNLLGIPPESIPPLVLKAIILDTFLVIGFIVLKRRRKQIWAGTRRMLRAGRKRVKTQCTRAALPRSSFHDPPEAARCARNPPSRSSAPCRMKLAAAESIRSLRFLRDTSISISARSAATVDNRSSQNTNGRSVFCAMLRTKARVAWARGPSLPSMFTGRPITAAPA